MDYFDDKGSGSGFALIVIPAMVICCALPILLIGGSFSGFWAWMAEGAFATILLALIAGIAVIFIYRNRADFLQKEQHDEIHPPAPKTNTPGKHHTGPI